ncbi:hypothetical protein T492DRAFT_1078068 [Pavlovales sp. CCMP2436]|nr:hypothetical protein T492DRAFT_1078068 [Pavlovales sp. CCMP2436]
MRKKSRLGRNSKGSKSKGGTKDAAMAEARDRRANLKLEGLRRAARAAPPTDVTGWCVSAGTEPPRCSRRNGCTHAPGAAENCTLIGGGASDVDSDGGASLPSAKPERGFPCDEPGCEFTATRSGQLAAHNCTHSGERSYACDEPSCEYRAVHAGTLTRHKRTHSDERPFTCDTSTEEQRNVRRKELNAAAQRRSRALRKERLAEEAVAAIVELAAARSPAGVHALRERREGMPGGGDGGSCSARRTSKAGLGKMDERQAQGCAHKQGEHESAKFGAMILEIARDPASGRSDSRALLFRRTVARR